MLAKSVISFNFPLFFHTATFAEAVERFNSNIPYNGLLHAVTQDVSTVGHSVSPFVSVSCFVTNFFFLVLNCQLFVFSAGAVCWKQGKAHNRSNHCTFSNGRWDTLPYDVYIVLKNFFPMNTYYFLNQNIKNYTQSFHHYIPSKGYTVSMNMFLLGDQNTISVEDLEGQFQAIRRLVASKAGFEAFTTLPK